MVLRSMLFAPATHARHADKALHGEADGAILDLEDAVAVSEKPSARAAVRDLIDGAASGGCVPVFVRINGMSTPFAYQDLCTVVRPGLHGIVVPKVETAAQMFAVDWLVTQLERERELPAGSVQLLPILETAVGVLNATEIGRSSARVARLNFGAGDFTLDTGMTWQAGLSGLSWARVQVVLASRASGLDAPIDTVYPDLNDDDGLRREATEAKLLGFGGKACIHPKQVTSVNELFTPTRDEVAEASRVVEAFREAEQQGSASIQLDGHFVDYPVVEKARRVLQLHEQSRQMEES